MEGSAHPYKHVPACTTQTDSNRQHFQELFPTVLVAAACRSYKYSNSRTKIGISTLLLLQESLDRAGKAGSRKHCLRSMSCLSRTKLAVLDASPREMPAGPSTQLRGHRVLLTLYAWPYPHAPHGPYQPAAIPAGAQINRSRWKRDHSQQIGEGTATALGEVSRLGTAACLLPTSLLSSSWCCFPVLLLALFGRTRQWEGAPCPTEPPAWCTALRRLLASHPPGKLQHWARHRLLQPPWKVESENGLGWKGP